MTCNLNESQIQAWLDGDEDHSLHAAECSHCQQQLALAHKVRTRLSPPPSPLGRDFAQRTAARVLRQTLVTDVVQRTRNDRSAPWWKRVLDNPLVQILQRERTRRLLRAPGLVAVLMLYLVPGLFVMQGDAENQWAYFGILRMGLTWIVPIFLLTIEMTTLSGLVRGRCLEEMLQTGLEPKLVSDTLAFNGLRSLVPVLLLSSVALLPLQPSLLVASWLPITVLTLLGCCYLTQAHLLVPAWPRWLSALGTGCAVASLAASAPWNGLALLALCGLAVWARQRSWQSLAEQQHGQTPPVQRCQPGKLQNWLARRLPDLALLQRELRRRSVVSAGMLLVNAVFMAGFLYIFGVSGSHDIWPFFMAFPATVVGFGLLSREKESGGYEVLVHSGVRFQDWWVSTVWLAALQFAPILLTLSVLAGYQRQAEGLLVCGAMGLGVGCSLFVSLWAGAVIGASAGLTTDSPRQAALRCVRELVLVSALSLLLVGVSEPLFGPQSFLQDLLSSLGLTLDRFLNLTDILPVTLALYFRARLLRQPDQKPGRAFNPWLLCLAPALPSVLWLLLRLDNNVRLANWTGWVAAILSLAWMWWVAPQAQAPTARKWLALTVSYLVTVGLGIVAVLWMIGVNTSQWELLLGLEYVDWAQTILVVALWSALVALLGRRNQWAGRAEFPGGEWRRRSLWAASVFGLGAVLVAGQLARMGLGRAPSTEISAFVAKNYSVPNHNPVLERSLKRFFGLRAYDPYSRSFPSFSLTGSRTIEDPRNQSTFDRDALGQMGKNPELLAGLVGQMQTQSGRGDAKEVRQLFGLSTIRLRDALFQKHWATAVQSLEWMAWLAKEAFQVGVASDGFAMCRGIREQTILAIRSQQLSAEQLQRLRQLMAQLPDDNKSWQVQRDRQAAIVYQSMLHTQDQSHWDWTMMQRSATGRLFMKYQAETFLGDYLSGKMAADKMPRSERDTIARRSLWEVTSGWSLAADNNQFLRIVGTQVLELERYRMDHGRFPGELKARGLKMRVAYTTDGAHYSLKVWGERDQPYPLIFSTISDSGFQIRR